MVLLVDYLFPPEKIVSQNLLSALFLCMQYGILHQPALMGQNSGSFATPQPSTLAVICVLERWRQRGAKYRLSGEI